MHGPSRHACSVSVTASFLLNMPLPSLSPALTAPYSQHVPLPFVSPQAVAIHGDISQAQRTAAVDKFKSGQVPLLVATDVAARGLDIPDVEVRGG